MFINELIEWIASKFSFRFKIYRDARHKLDTYRKINKLNDSLENINMKQRKSLRNDPELLEIERIFHDVIKLCLKEDDQQNVAMVYYELGILYRIQCKIQESWDCFQKCIELLNNMPFSNKIQKKAVSNSHYYLGFLGLDINDMKLAKKEFEKSMAIDKALNDRVSLLITKNVISHYNLNGEI